MTKKQRDKPKLCILAYDGLDYRLVEKFNLKHLKQEEYGKTDISDFKYKSTPILWGSFICGENIEQDILKENTTWKFLRKISPIRRFLRKSRILADILSFSGKFVKNKNLNINVKDFNKKTIFGHFNSKPISVPSYNKEEWKDRYHLGDVIEGKVTEKEYEERVWANYKAYKEKLLSSLRGNHQLIMAWTDLADLLGHVYRPRLKKMKEIYAELNNLTEEVGRKFDGWILIVSDHGMEPLGRYGDHSKISYGYWSSNHKLGIKNPKITDFFNIIRNKLKGQSIEIKRKEAIKKITTSSDRVEDDQKEMMKRLKELGYF